jgi:hypothetical protein
MDYATEMLKFRKLDWQGRRAALDLNRETGEVMVVCSHNQETKEDGLGAIPQCREGAWIRIAYSANV